MQPNPTTQSPILPRSLGGGLVLRRSTIDDTERLSEFNARIHGEDENDARAVAVWTADLMTGKHPTFGVGDFTIVEDSASGKIVSAMNLISQIWTYAGIPFGVGRPELVGTDPEYRRRGLVRLQFDVAHAWSAERGELLQGITGIPFYYRQFGYEMAVNLDGARITYPMHVPGLGEGESEPCRVRAAVEADLPFIAQVYDDSCGRSLLAACWDAALWRHELLDKSPENVNRHDLKIIESLDGEPLGYLSLPYNLWGATMGLKQFELKPGASWPQVAPTVLRYVLQVGKERAARSGKELERISFHLGDQHPAYDALGGYLPIRKNPYSWYIRVPDLPAFLRLIAPVLEERLKSSIFAGYTGEFKLSFYRAGLLLTFDRGRLQSIDPARYEWHESDANFPNLTFLQLLFGYRSMAELDDAFTDCFARDSKTPLINVLFPKQCSNIEPIS